MDAARNALDLLVSPLIQERAARVRDHRPWPAPNRPWVMAQSWVDLLFAHWSVSPQELVRTVPPQLPLDTHEGRAWVAVTPFEVRNMRPRSALPVPWLSAFPEVNVRTYVTVDGKPGIYFFSLDAASGLAVGAARRFYRLPYFRAHMSIGRAGGAVDYLSDRSRHEDAPAAQLRCRYWPIGPPALPVPGTLEHWLTERYCLYTLDDRERVLRAEIQHPPWPLQPAEADIAVNTMTAEIGVQLSGQRLLHYSRRQDVAFWTLQDART